LNNFSVLYCQCHFGKLKFS